jgi:hypothetical protein
MSLQTGQPDSTDGCQSALVDKLGVSFSQYYHTMVHIANHQGTNNTPVKAAVMRRQSHPITTNLLIPGSLQNVKFGTDNTSIARISIRPVTYKSSTISGIVTRLWFLSL